MLDEVRKALKAVELYAKWSRGSYEGNGDTLADDAFDRAERGLALLSGYREIADKRWGIVNPYGEFCLETYQSEADAQDDMQSGDAVVAVLVLVETGERMRGVPGLALKNIPG